MHNFSNVTLQDYKINLFLYFSNKTSDNKIKKTIPFKNNKILRNKFNKTSAKI